jgi:hypothetical protein
MTSMGQVGIGTSAPSAKLQVNGDGTGAAIYATQGSLTLQPGTALQGLTTGASGTGVSGSATDGVGVRGTGTTYGVYCAGNFAATGSKAFVQPHPSDPTKEIHFACLEGNESGTYFRGKIRLSGGNARIDVPEEFRLVSEPEGLTVQLTPVGHVAVWIESYDLEHVTIAGESDVEVHYTVNGVRRGFSRLELVQENHAFRPEVRGQPYGAQYPEELREILVQNGILNPDYTPNEATAARLGWQLSDEDRRFPRAAAESVSKPRAAREE